MQAFPKSPLELHTMHANQAVRLDEVHNIINGAVEIERSFIRGALLLAFFGEFVCAVLVCVCIREVLILMHGVSGARRDERAWRGAQVDHNH